MDVQDREGNDWGSLSLPLRSPTCLPMVGVSVLCLFSDPVCVCVCVYLCPPSPPPKTSLLPRVGLTNPWQVQDCESPALLPQSSPGKGPAEAGFCGNLPYSHLLLGFLPFPPPPLLLCLLMVSPESPSLICHLHNPQFRICFLEIHPETEILEGLVKTCSSSPAPLHPTPESKCKGDERGASDIKVPVLNH